MVVALLLLPAIALAQSGSQTDGPQVCGFYGEVTLNGASVEKGTVVKAIVGGAEVESTTTGSNLQLAADEYMISVGGNYAGETVSFVVGDNSPAIETKKWVSGERYELNLNAFPAAKNLKLTVTPAEGIGTNVCGTGFTPGRIVTVKVDGQKAAMETVNADGEFCTSVISTKSTAGSCTIEASDGIRSAQATFTAATAQGQKGDKGDTGAAGAAGATGPKGADGEDAAGSSSVLAIVALIIAIIAVILAIVFGIRGKQKPAA